MQTRVLNAHLVAAAQMLSPVSGCFCSLICSEQLCLCLSPPIDVRLCARGSRLVTVMGQLPVHRAALLLEVLVHAMAMQCDNDAMLGGSRYQSAPLHWLSWQCLHIYPTSGASNCSSG
jgi:hypothetical protein